MMKMVFAAESGTRTGLPPATLALTLVLLAVPMQVIGLPRAMTSDITENLVETSQEPRDKRGLFNAGGVGGVGGSSSHPILNSILLNAGMGVGGGLGVTATEVTDVAQAAAGHAHLVATQQEEAEWKAASLASKKIAEKASSAAQRAQEAAAHKYQQAAYLTQATQAAQVSAFREAAAAAQTGKALQAVDALVEWATQQQHALSEVLAASEAQTAQAQTVREVIHQAYRAQAQEAWKAQQIAQHLLQQQALGMQHLDKAQMAAQKAVAAAQKALAKAKGTAKSAVYG
ncbi:uncharacterized abhydrolase domain-containing protein DDB_G0269086-like [Penaeus japonicus]|uniref:uncharacterized abhydrolase domain-containing protein DDB_G0269086-like n=1 Tax=Penaeus japonicus TaxID=27405 RepID=UPI001C716173|nr:uncharacterized abhydrolase domain-containing protein DDB_G0269086-like [Penaeus japonicus]